VGPTCVDQSRGIRFAPIGLAFWVDHFADGLVMTALPFVFLLSGGPLDGELAPGDASDIDSAVGNFGSIAYRDTSEGRVGAAMEIVYPSNESASANTTVQFHRHCYVVSHRMPGADGRLEIHAQYFGRVDLAEEVRSSNSDPRDAGTGSARRARRR